MPSLNFPENNVLQSQDEVPYKMGKFCIKRIESTLVSFIAINPIPTVVINLVFLCKFELKLDLNYILFHGYLNLYLVTRNYYCKLSI